MVICGVQLEPGRQPKDFADYARETRGDGCLNTKPDGVGRGRRGRYRLPGGRRGRD
jgi:hypothetical protein